ncbi:MAG: hypothetical protein ACK4SL_00480 [Candidatus Paceibacteria bacterium]
MGGSQGERLAVLRSLIVELIVLQYVSFANFSALAIHLTATAELVTVLIIKRKIARANI